MAGQPHIDGPDAQDAPGLRLIGPGPERALGLLAAVLILALVAVTCIDVVGRYVMDAPLDGAFEMTELMLLALVFAALPLTTGRREHVEVDILAMGLGPRAGDLMARFAALFSAAVLLTFGWRLAVHALKAGADGTVTNALAIPYAPFGWVAALSCLASAIVAGLIALRGPQAGDRP